VAVDTEAFGDAVFAPRKQWIGAQHLDAIVSTDGDGDRPLIIDAGGEFVRGDAIGLITAQFVGAQTVVTPVTSNSAIEGAGGFRFVQRTKVGSPFVIAGMTAMAQRGGVVVGFEANGGVLLATDAEVNGRTLTALPTRDALLPILSVLGAAARDGLTLAQLVQKLPLRAALADRLGEVATDRSAGFVRKLMDKNFAAQFFAPVGEVESVSTIDGPRFSLVSGDTVHYRASGNAPELRCYVEGVTPERAEELLRWGLDAAAKIVRG
jgi:phosphomannomutase